MHARLQDRRGRSEGRDCEWFIYHSTYSVRLSFFLWIVRESVQSTIVLRREHIEADESAEAFFAGFDPDRLL